MRKILGVNISHNCSFAYFEDNILKEYYEEDRFNKIKHYQPEENELAEYTYNYIVLKKFKDITFDVIVFASYDRGHLQIELPIIKHILKQVKYKKYYFDIKNHHIYHAICGYFFSKFNEAVALISDGGGEIDLKHYFRTIQSIYVINKKQIIPKYKYLSNKKIDYFDNFVPAEEHKKNNVDYVISNKLRSGLRYIYYLQKAGFAEGEEGQMMGIAAYKNKNTDIPKKILEIANKAQEETLQETIELVDKIKQYSDCKNVILSGGYHMNCSNNFKLVKHFPKYSFFVDPVAYDGGTAIGAALYYENYL
jgi:predicted NodU family carbamoyl transferase|tara:strand:+ start:210 stop:1130 length:921 start_codon:yes stop_codon:yes gene_type:complete